MVRLAAGWRPAITRATLGCRVRGFVLPGLLLAAACWPHVGAELAGLGEWLDGLGEGAWRGALEGAGYATVEHLAASGLTEAELAQLGLPLKARRRISKVPGTVAGGWSGWWSVMAAGAGGVDDGEDASVRRWRCG